MVVFLVLVAVAVVLLTVRRRRREARTFGKLGEAISTAVRPESAPRFARTPAGRRVGRRK